MVREGRKGGGGVVKTGERERERERDKNRVLIMDNRLLNYLFLNCASLVLIKAFLAGFFHPEFH